MKIEIITIGDEILAGDIIDTNTAYLSEQLWLHGFHVAYHTGIRDDAVEIKKALLYAAERAELVLVSGGLGATADDFTMEVAAQAFRRKLVCDESTLAYLESLAKRWDRPLSENNKKQAYVPSGARTLKNRVGTAPGVALAYKAIPFYFFPGVPKELKQLFTDFVLPEILQEHQPAQHFTSRFFKCFGLAESDLDQKIAPLYQDRLNIDQVRIGFRAHFPETYIKLSAWHESSAQANELIEKAEMKVREKIGTYIYGGRDDSLESVVGGLLRANKKTVAVAESCTGGTISNRITNVAGSSEYFKNGVVTYSNSAKVAVLGVSPTTISKEGAISSQCAIEMAQGVRRISKTHYGIAVTGIAGPGGGTADKPVGTVHIALASQNGTQEKKFYFPLNRDWFKAIVSSIALDWLRKELLGLASNHKAA